MLLVGWVVLGLFASNPAALLGLAFIQGAFAFAVGSTLIARVLYEASEAPTMGGVYATAAFNVGAAIGPVIAAVALTTRLATLGAVWASAALVAVALLIVFAARGVFATVPLGSRAGSVPECAALAEHR